MVQWRLSQFCCESHHNRHGYVDPTHIEGLQLIRDDSGTVVRVSVAFCVTPSVIYLWLFIVSVCVVLHLRKNKTGLQWNPSTLAAQLALVQGSNIFDQRLGPEAAGRGSELLSPVHPDGLCVSCPQPYPSVSRVLVVGGARHRRSHEVSSYASRPRLLVRCLHWNG